MKQKPKPKTNRTKRKSPSYRTINLFECNNLAFTQFYKLHDNKLCNNKLFDLVLYINLC